jgi:hypothetical protein
LLELDLLGGEEGEQGVEGETANRV